MSEERAGILKEEEPTAERKELFVSEELMQQKFFNAIPFMRDSARELIAMKAYLQKSPVASESSEQIKINERVVVPEDIVALVEYSLGRRGKGPTAEPDFTIPVAFAAAFARMWEFLDALLREQRESGADIPEGQFDGIETNVRKFRELFNVSLGLKEFTDPGTNELSAWLKTHYERLKDVSALAEGHPVRDQTKSEIRANLPLFERFLEGRQVAGDYDLLLGEVDEEARAEINALADELLYYTSLENATFRSPGGTSPGRGIYTGLHAVVQLKRLDREIRRKQHGE